jgi:hypothetical protein
LTLLTRGEAPLKGNRERSGPFHSWRGWRTLVGFAMALVVTIVSVVVLSVEAKRHHFRFRWLGGWVWSHERIPQEFKEGPYTLYAYFRHLRAGPLSFAASEEPLDPERRVAKKSQGLDRCRGFIERGDLGNAENEHSQILNQPVAVGDSPLMVFREYILFPHQIALAKGDYSASKRILKDGPPSNSPLPV